jgi:hypothetical protein
MSQLKTVQWNVGGARLCREGADPGLLASYTVDGLDEIIEFLREQNPDIITLQETHARGDYCQPQIIAEALGYKGWVNDEWADSHIEAGMRLGQGIVSRYAMEDHSFEWFTNPHWQIAWEGGDTAMSHDKGRTRCQVALDAGRKITAQTLHTIPFGRFKVDILSDKVRQVLGDMSVKLLTHDPGILQADFNLNTPSLSDLLPELFRAGFEEVIQAEPTTPKGAHSDHVLFLGMRVVSSNAINDVLTDHFPIITLFELND